VVPAAIRVTVPRTGPKGMGSVLVVGSDCSLPEALRMIEKRQAVATEWADEPAQPVARDGDLQTATIEPSKDTATIRRGRRK
jgi:hypothetical protein